MPGRTLRRVVPLLALQLWACEAGLSRRPFDAPPPTPEMPARELSFAEPDDYFIENSLPQALAIEDLTGDGTPDMVVTNYERRDVVLFRGLPGGRFDPAFEPLTSSEHPFGLVLVPGGLSGQGPTDLVIAEWGTGAPDSGGLAILAGLGGGRYKPARRIGTGATSRVAAGDLNGDGNVDMVALGSSGRVTVLINNGAGDFTSARDSLPSNTGASEVLIEDVDGVGGRDVLLAGSHIWVYLGVGNGTFQPRGAYALERGATQVPVAQDFDRDGIIDLAVPTGAGGVVAVLLGKGDGTFTDPTPVSASMIDASAVSAVDLDGDRKVDLAVTRYRSGLVDILHGNGDGTFRQGESSYRVRCPPVSESGASFIKAHDLDDDGDNDLAVVVKSCWQISVLRNTSHD